MNARNVLHVDEFAEQTAYRNSVAQIIGDIQAAHGKELTDIAEEIDVSRGTMSNAFNKKCDLSPIYLKRLGKKYGAAFLNPYFALFGAQAAPIGRRTKDILPIVTRVAHKIALARDPEGPGGTTEVPQERKAYLNDLKELQHETGSLISEVEMA